MTINKGIWHMLAATFFFSLMNICIKKVSYIPPMETTFFRCLVSMLCCFVIIGRDHLDWRGSNRFMLIARGVAGTMAVVTFIITLQHLPLAPAVTIQYTSPIFTIIIASLILREQMRWMQYLFFVISFTGVILIKGFDGNISMPYLALGLFSAFCSGIAYNLVRSLKKKEHPMVVVLHFQLVGTVIGFIGMLIGYVYRERGHANTFFDWRMPQGIDWIYLLLTGLLTQLGQTNLTKALQSERMAITSSLSYLGILYALIFGVFFFGESYTVSIITGIILVVAGVLLNVIFGKKEHVIVAEDE